jgi:hypothetical protein
MKNFNPFKIGLTEEMDTEFRRVTILTNVVYSILLVLLTGYLVFYLPYYLKISQITWFTAVPWLAWFGVIGGLLLNKLRFHRMSKFIFIITWIGVVNVLPAMSGNARPSSFILYPMYCMITLGDNSFDVFTNPGKVYLFSDYLIYLGTYYFFARIPFLLQPQCGFEWDLSCWDWSV